MEDKTCDEGALALKVFFFDNFSLVTTRKICQTVWVKKNRVLVTWSHCKVHAESPWSFWLKYSIAQVHQQWQPKITASRHPSFAFFPQFLSSHPKWMLMRFSSRQQQFLCLQRPCATWHVTSSSLSLLLARYQLPWEIFFFASQHRVWGKIVSGFTVLI